MAATDRGVYYRQPCMKISYDKQVDAAYLYLAESTPGAAATTYTCDGKAVGGEINLDFNAEGVLIGIEVLNASKKLPKELLGTAQ